VRYHAALSLGDIGDTDAVIPLIKALNDPREDVRRGIVESLGRLGDKRAVAALERQRKSESKNDERLVAAVIDTVLPGCARAAKWSRAPKSACCRSPLSTRRRSSPRRRFWRRVFGSQHRGEFGRQRFVSFSFDAGVLRVRIESGHARAGVLPIVSTRYVV
jgi:hypothetical protein